MDNSNNITITDEYSKTIPLDNNQKLSWIKCVKILYNTLKVSPFIVNSSDKIPAEQFNIDTQLTTNDYKQIWKWILDEYKYHGKYYRSQILEKEYFKNYSLQDEPQKFIRNAPTNTIRTLKYYSGIIGLKEKELINKCLVDFYNYCLGYKGDVRYAGLLTLLVYMYSNAKTVLEKKPPLNQSELDDIFKDPRLMLPEDMSKVIGEYLGS